MTANEVRRPAILRALLLGLGWIAGQMDEFRIGFIDPDDFSKASVARLKPLSELALTINVLRRTGLGLPFLSTSAEWIWRECDHGRGLVKLMLARNDFLPACSIHASMFELGYRSPPLHATLKLLSRSRMARVLPLQPWARLALDYNLWKLKLLPESRIRRSGLYVLARPEPWVMSGEIAYAITHEVLYLSDFGFKPFTDADGYLQTWLPYWSRIFTEEANWDIVGELAMVSTCLHSATWYDADLASIIDQQRQDGSVNGPEGAGSFLYAQGDSAARREFLSSYHTTLVAVMAMAMALRALPAASSA